MSLVIELSDLLDFAFASTHHRHDCVALQPFPATIQHYKLPLYICFSSLVLHTNTHYFLVLIIKVVIQFSRVKDTAFETLCARNITALWN